MAHSQIVPDNLYEQFIQTAANIIRYHKGDEREKVLKELRDHVETTYILQSRLKSVTQVRDRLLAEHDAKKNAAADVKVFVKKYKEIANQIREDRSANEQVSDYDNKIKTLLEIEDGNNQVDEEGELLVTQEQINVIDPVTKKRMVDPVKNKICGHTYDRKTVEALLKVKKKARCPVPGCKSENPMSLNNLETDIVVKQYLQRNPK